MGPCTGHGSGGTRISSAYNIRWRVSIPSFICVTFGHVIHRLVQHIPTEGGSEQEGDLSFKFYSIKVCNICYLASIFIRKIVGHPDMSDIATGISDGLEQNVQTCTA